MTWRVSTTEWPNHVRDLETFSDEELNALCAEINRIQCDRSNSVLKPIEQSDMDMLTDAQKEIDRSRSLRERLSAQPPGGIQLEKDPKTCRYCISQDHPA
jgi:hypothetical protein